MTIERFFLDVFVFGFPVLVLWIIILSYFIVLFAAAGRIVLVGGEKFNREVKDFFTPKTILMLRKLER